MLSKKIHIYNAAKDNAKISNIYNQLSNIPTQYQKYDNINVILSVGGNDLLEGDDINVTYTKYIQIIHDILNNHIKGNGKTYLLNLYYPPNKHFRIFDTIISDWNNRLAKLANNPKIVLVDLTHIMNNTDDFTHTIEPSKTGGTKIVQAITSSI
jgi:hypothetical protein